jgi:hypothetical protein
VTRDTDFYEKKRFVGAIGAEKRQKTDGRGHGAIKEGRAKGISEAVQVARQCLGYLFNEEPVGRLLQKKGSS